VEYENCHPYRKRDCRGRNWTLIHNGTIFEYEPLNRYVTFQEGDTDSERILLYLVDQINQAELKKRTPLTKEERFRLLDQIIPGMAEGNKLNLIFYDGELFYVHTNFQDSLYELEEEEQVIFSTQPLGREKNRWKPVRFTTLLAFEDGEEAFVGTTHDNVYVPSEENLKFLYSIFADL
jgi:glutamine amidotransferase